MKADPRDWRNRENPFHAEPTNHRLSPGNWEYGTRYAYVRDRIARGSKVLDVGCNCGQLSKNLTYDLGCKVWGIDIVPQFIRHCQTMSEAPDLGPFVVGDFSRMSEEQLEEAGLLPGHFDYVTALEVIEHPIGLYGFRKNLRTVLKIGGRFIFTTPDEGNVNVQNWLRMPFHVTIWTPGSLARWLGPLEDYTRLPKENGQPDYLAGTWHWQGKMHVDDELYKRIQELNDIKWGLVEEGE